MDPQVQSAVIGGVFGLLGIALGCGITVWSGRRAGKVQDLEEDLARAKKDIEFLLEAERIHCEMHRQTVGKPHKNLIRAEILRTGRFTWSGRFTPGRNRAARES